MVRTPTSLFLLVALTLVPYGAAVDPLGDDAGSGGDAGDDPGSALVVPMGAHTGRLTAPHDLMDHYAFAGTRGDILRIALDLPGGVQMGGRLLGPAPQHGEQFLPWQFLYGTTTYVLPETGTWVLQVALHGRPIGGHAYGFSLERLDGTAEVFVVTDEWVHFRSARAGPGEGFAMIQAVAEGAFATGPFIAQVFGEARSTGTSGGSYGSAGGGQFQGSSLGRSVRVGGTAIEIPQGDHPVGVMTVMDGGGWSDGNDFRSRLYGFTGNARATYWITSWLPGGSTTLESGDGVFVWSDENAGTDDQLLTPVYSKTGARALDLDVDGRYLGWFGSTFRDADTRAIAPDGTIHADRSISLVDVELGRWRFEVGPTGSAGFRGDEVLLAGVQLP